MTRPLHRLRGVTLAFAIVLVLSLSRCANSPSPSVSPGQVASAPPPVTAVAPPASGQPGSSPVPSSNATPAGSSPACAVTSQSGLLPSDRLVDLKISSTPTHDLLTFVFAASTPSPAGPARGTLDAATPPFTFAGSGLPVELLGEHAVQLRFSGMTIAGESGDATYHGPIDAKPALPALREAIQYDASEGIVGWYVGYDGPGCVSLVRDGNNVTVSIAHAAAPAG